MLGEAPVDDRDRRVLLRIHAREVASLEDRDPHRPEVARRERVHERLDVLAVRRAVALDRHRAVPLGAGKNRDAGERRRLDAGCGPKLLEQLLVEFTARSS